MKILHIISQHPESTGSGIYLRNIIRCAAAAGHQNFLIAGISNNLKPTLDDGYIDEKSSTFVRFDGGDLDFTIPGMSDVMPYASSKFGRLTDEQLDAYEHAFAKTIRHAVNEFQPDIIHSHHLWLVSAVARQVAPDLPMVTSCHSTDLRQFIQCPRLRRRVLPDCLRIDRVLALSHGQKENIHAIYGIEDSRIDVVGGGFDKTVFSLLDKEKPEPVQLLYAGKLSYAKGVDWLLHTFLTLNGHRLHLHLAGSGSGSEAEKCLELAKSAGTTVTIHGRISQSELAELMSRCHIFILPSFFEGLPLVLLEALASGCRIITTDLPCCLELLGEAEQELVEFIKLPALQSVDRPDPADMDLLQTRLAQAIMAMADRVRTAPSPSRREIQRVTSSHDWNSVFRRIFSAYEKAVALGAA